jgi:hypothetical protein
MEVGCQLQAPAALSSYKFSKGFVSAPESGRVEM